MKLLRLFLVGAPLLIGAAGLEGMDNMKPAKKPQIWSNAALMDPDFTSSLLFDLMKIRHHEDTGALDLLDQVGNKIDKDARDSRGNNLLHVAAQHGNEQLFERLVSLGVDPEQRNHDGKKVLDLIQLSKQSSVQDWIREIQLRSDYKVIESLDCEQDYHDGNIEE